MTPPGGIFGPWVPRPARPSVPSRVARPTRAARVPVGAYTKRVTDLPLSGAQILATLNGSGNARGQVAPTGLGTIWYPASITLYDSAATFDKVKVDIYVGPSQVPTTLIGSLPLGGNGTVALALPSISPGLAIIVVWTGGTAGATVTANVVGTMSALTW